jgi:hypothetical protein
MTLLRGVNWSGLEYRSTQGLTLQLLTNIKNQWNINILRYCFNRADYLNNYAGCQQTMRTVQGWCQSLGITIIFDQQWEDSSSGTVPLPSLSGSVQLWTAIANESAYKNNTLVWFDIWNEPHDCTIGQWKPIASACVDAVRNAGANNICVVGGLDWCTDMRPWHNNYLTQTGVIYSVHVYGTANNHSTLDMKVGPALEDNITVFFGEFGTNANGGASSTEIAWIRDDLLHWLDGTNRGSGIPTIPLGWAAWSMTASTPCLANSDHLTPTAYGQVVKDKLNSQPIPTYKYKCTGAPDYQCIVDPNGTYNSLIECQNVCKSPTTTKYSCSGAPNYQCIADQNGTYNSLIECQTACKNPNPIPTSKFTVNKLGNTITIQKRNRGDKTADQACKTTCDMLKTM